MPPPSSDAEQFAAELEHYRRALIALALDRTGRWDVAEDITQQTITTAWEHRADLRDPGSLRGWLWRIAVNSCTQWQRREVRFGDPGETGPRSPRRAVVDEVIRRESIREARAALACLPFRNRVAVLMHFAGYSYDEIADFLQIPKTTLRGRISRARDHLRRDLARRLDLHSEKEKA